MLKVREIMATDLFTLKEDDSLYDAKQVMELARIRHVPIVSQTNEFRGLITHRDMLALAVSSFAEIDTATQHQLDVGVPIKEIMKTDVLTVSADHPLRDAAQMLLENKYGCLPVVENNILVGIVTESDFLQLTINLMDALDPS
ncbi:CBS domain-containing protein [Desulfovibrio inopinatus]|uniref:CBS domain-containing protein n=1 Tax=Desulfovibrio inopinatus TaxID=102109 RepID=UPI0003F71C81|nr:CBS domain-containing protein [Desulfovibrio inopinatus]